MEKVSKNKIWEFSNEVYPRKLWIVVDNTELVKKSFINSTDDSEIEDDAFKGAFGTTLNVREKNGEQWKGIVIHFSDVLLQSGGCQMVSTITHECIHTVNMIFREIDVNYTKWEDEHFAYLAGWVSRKCWEVLQKYV